MKFLFDGEDTVLGMILGIVLIGKSGKYFSLGFADQLLYLLIPLCLLFAVLDVAHHLQHIFENLAPYILILGHNAVNLALLVGMGSSIIGFFLPVVTSIGGAALSPAYVFVTGAYFTVSYAIHAIYEKLVG